MSNQATPLPNIAQTIAQHEAAKPKKKPAPHILIVGSSGSGKSSSIEKLPKNITTVLNVENKTLPFKDEDLFTQHGDFNFVAEVDNKIKNLDQTQKIIVMDSFTKYLEMLMAEARQRNKGYDIFNYYNTAVYNFLEMLKKQTDRVFILLGIDELVKIEQDSGAIQNKRYLSTEGKVWLGKIEKEFSIVLYSIAKPIPGSTPPKISYQFQTNTDGINSAKSPRDMFEYSIPNDLGFVMNKVQEYFKLSL